MWQANATTSDHQGSHTGASAPRRSYSNSPAPSYRARASSLESQPEIPAPLPSPIQPHGDPEYDRLFGMALHEPVIPSRSPGPAVRAWYLAAERAVARLSTPIPGTQALWFAYTRMERERESGTAAPGHSVRVPGSPVAGNVLPGTFISIASPPPYAPQAPIVRRKVDSVLELPARTARQRNRARYKVVLGTAATIVFIVILAAVVSSQCYKDEQEGPIAGRAPNTFVDDEGDVVVWR